MDGRWTAMHNQCDDWLKNTDWRKKGMLTTAQNQQWCFMLLLFYLQLNHLSFFSSLSVKWTDRITIKGQNIKRTFTPRTKTRFSLKLFLVAIKAVFSSRRDCSSRVVYVNNTVEIGETEKQNNPQILFFQKFWKALNK